VTDSDASVVLPGDAVSIPLARQWLRLLLVEAGAGVDAIEAAAAVLSELVDNAVEHAHAPVRVSVSMLPGAVHCEVIDPSPVLPEVRGPDTLVHEFRGLELVDALCSRWGFESIEGDGKVVWFEV
jgi:anti-sigma regulatory factor (Ser/Thr protein kinase)